jgi:hypothetical protein
MGCRRQFHAAARRWMLDAIGAGAWTLDSSKKGFQRTGALLQASPYGVKVPCLSVGHLIARTENAIALAPNLGDIGREYLQASGILRVPRSAVRSMRVLLQ